MSCHRTFPVIASVFSILLAAGSARADLIVNGGFETANFTGWETESASSGSLFGVLGGQTHTGDYAAGFAAFLYQPDAIYQIVPTVAGQQYMLTFWLWNSAPHGNDYFSVSWEGTTVLELGPLDVTDGWEQHTLILTATMSGSELRFASYDFYEFIYLDDVSLVPLGAAVPSPASATLGVIGAGMMLLRRRR